MVLFFEYRNCYIETGSIQATPAEDRNKFILSFIAVTKAVCVSCRVLVVSPIHGWPALDGDAGKEEHTSIVPDVPAAAHRLTGSCDVTLWRWQGDSSELSRMWSVFSERTRTHRRTTFVRSCGLGRTILCGLLSLGHISICGNASKHLVSKVNRRLAQS